MDFRFYAYENVRIHLNNLVIVNILKETHVRDKHMHLMDGGNTLRIDLEFIMLFLNKISYTFNF